MKQYQKEVDIKKYSTEIRKLLNHIQNDYGYSDDLVAIIENELNILLDRIDKGVIPFNSEVVMSDYQIYCNLKKQLNRKKKKSTNESITNQRESHN